MKCGLHTIIPAPDCWARTLRGSFRAQAPHGHRDGARSPADLLSALRPDAATACALFSIVFRDECPCGKRKENKGANGRSAMVILWKRITGILFAIVMLVLLMRGGIPVECAFESLGEMGAGHGWKLEVERFDHPGSALHHARGHHHQVVNLAIREVGDSGMQSPISGRDPLSVFENQGLRLQRDSAKATKFIVEQICRLELRDFIKQLRIPSEPQEVQKQRIPGAGRCGMLTGSVKQAEGTVSVQEHLDGILQIPGLLPEGMRKLEGFSRNRRHGQDVENQMHACIGAIAQKPRDLLDRQSLLGEASCQQLALSRERYDQHVIHLLTRHFSSEASDG